MSSRGLLCTALQKRDDVARGRILEAIGTDLQGLTAKGCGIAVRQPFHGIASQQLAGWLTSR
jgi:hypothetical protein